MIVYTVRPGDTLSAIARRFGGSAEELARVNQLSDPNRLIPNLALLVPGSSGASRRDALVNAYAYPGVAGAVLRETLPSLSFLCPFSRRLTEKGELLPLDDTRMTEAALEADTAPFLTVTNLGESGGFSSRIAHAVLTEQAAQDAALRNIFDTLAAGRWAGVNFNLEYVYPFDRDSYSQFLRRAAELLHRGGWLLSTAIAPKESAAQEGLLYSAHDYAAQGQICDWVVLMTYEWGYTYSAPQAVSPVDRIRRVLDYAVTVMPPGKILLGFSNYGYRWRLPWRQGDAAAVISNAAAQNLAVSTRAQLQYDERAAAPHFVYTDAEGQRGEVWYEDARSALARLKLAEAYGLGGISIWTVDQLNRPLLLLIQDRFNVMKIL